MRLQVIELLSGQLEYVIVLILNSMFVFKTFDVYIKIYEEGYLF